MQRSAQSFREHGSHLGAPHWRERQVEEPPAKRSMSRQNAAISLETACTYIGLLLALAAPHQLRFLAWGFANASFA
jgi:hypothetical protein